MVHYDPDLSLVRLPMQALPHLINISYGRIPTHHPNTSLARTPFIPTGLHIYIYGDKESGSRIAAMLHENPMYGQLVAASAYNDFA